jgi:dihydroflavonol-4-reductase
VRKLVAKGHQVHVLSRPNNNRHNLEGLEIEIVEGDLTKPETYRNSLKDCRNLFHVAADYRIWVPNPDAMNKVNVDGTRALMVAALDAGVKRIVYTSSVATLGSTADGKPATEDTPVSFSNMIGPYKKSKFLAEQEVMRMIQHQQLPAVIVNPSTPVGPRDIKPTPTGRIVINALNGMIPAYVNTGLNVVHVDDVATGHLLALEQGKVGERYILGGTDMELREILAAIAKIAGHSPPKIKLPIKALYPVAYCMELTARYTGREPMLTRDSLEMAKKKMYFSSAKAEKELGYTFRPAEEAIADAITWFQAEWYC